jgi:hypothetical protein
LALTAFGLVGAAASLSRFWTFFGTETTNFAFLSRILKVLAMKFNVKNLAPPPEDGGALVHANCV